MTRRLREPALAWTSTEQQIRDTEHEFRGKPYRPATLPIRGLDLIFVDRRRPECGKHLKWYDWTTHESGGGCSAYVDALAKLIRQGVELPPIVVHSNGRTILDGNHRVLAAIRAKKTHVPAMVALSENPPSFGYALDSALDTLYPLVVIWKHYPSEGKEPLRLAYLALSPEEQEALAEDVLSAVRSAHVSDRFVAYRRGERAHNLRDMDSLTTAWEEVEYLGPEYRAAYLVHANDVLVHWAQPGVPLGRGAFAHEFEIILKPGAHPEEVRLDSENPIEVDSPERFTPKKRDALQRLACRVHHGRFERWLREQFDDPADLHGVTRTEDDSLGMLEQYLNEVGTLQVRDDGLIEFYQFFKDRDFDVARTIGDLPVVLYHHTASGAIPGILERGGLVPATRLGFRPRADLDESDLDESEPSSIGWHRSSLGYEQGQHVFLTTEPQGEVYSQRAVGRFGGDPITLEVMVYPHDLEPDPEDAHLGMTGRVQFVTDFVPLEHIIEGLG